MTTNEQQWRRVLRPHCVAPVRKPDSEPEAQGSMREGFQHQSTYKQSCNSADKFLSQKALTFEHGRLRLYPRGRFFQELENRECGSVLGDDGIVME